MEATSPPKRMTRARAAAKDAAKEDGAPPSTATLTKSLKAASTKATTSTNSSTQASIPTTRAATTTRTTKRKTRADENEDDADADQTNVEQQSTMNQPPKTRGRPKKVAAESSSEPQPEASIDDALPTSTAARATRGRAKKVTATATTAVKKPAVPKQEPIKTTRASTRTRKTPATDDGNADAPDGPVQKTTRSRATSNAKATTGVITDTVSTEPTPGLKSAVSRPASKASGVVKKTVSFQEPEKENRLPPPTKGKGKAKATAPATGMRAKPVRKPATTGRTTRASARTATTSEKRDKSPLSPKKDAQNLSLSRDVDSESDDELATLEKTPLKPMMKSPVKPPTGVRKPDLQLPAKDGDEPTTQETLEPIDASVFSSPARRQPPSSPWKDSMKSPAKKGESILSLAPPKNDQQAAQSPAKASTLQSPAKRPQLPIMALQPHSQGSGDVAHSPVKMSLLQSPAKRPTSPFKLQGPAQTSEDISTKLFAPKTSPTEEKAPEEDTQQNDYPEQIDVDDADDEVKLDKQPDENYVELESPSRLLPFPGRLSAVLPRHADPALRMNPLPAMDLQIEQPDSIPAKPVDTLERSIAEAGDDELGADAMEIDEPEHKEEPVPSPAPTTPPQSPLPRAINPAFNLRAKALEDNDVSDSEDELAMSNKFVAKYQEDTTQSLDGVPSTPTPSTSKTPRNGMPSSAMKAATRAIRSVSKGARYGFTPLANQLSEWKASSPTKQGNAGNVTSPGSKDEGFSMLKEDDATPSNRFFDEEMKIRAEMEQAQTAIEAALEADILANYEGPEFAGINITREDVELAAEANEMSLMEPSQIEEMKEGHARDDAVSEASQEYGDENAVPIDPALLGPSAGARRIEPVTPAHQSSQRTFHTVSKVPLKPADDSTPTIMKKRSASASKAVANRPDGLFRNATVISYSPTKDPDAMDIDEEDDAEHPPVTPSKADMWSSMGTPARTPRRDLNTSLLGGAVVFVDVHTTEGADASTIFVELLTQMGARCVKSWSWNPASPTNGEGSMSKIGITHVVYKDGGKRTLEKVRETGGVVQCVGVGWVLDCERENEWLDEAPYLIDTSLVPRGGRNRRKSMEPKALANSNGTLVTPIKNNAGNVRECQTVPNNHISRRDSTAWMRTPSDHDEDEDAPGEHDWEMSMLTPVPKTPAPEAVARFAMDVTPDTTSAIDFNQGSSENEQLFLRTCPPKKSTGPYADLGQGVLGQEKDQGIMMRLMAARRKSLQFAPKIASPLSKAWN
ncbi:hypothetical protein GGR54DRAFT_611156 [Hypoxylon sp. NC1633]|nr:hypothetical protein GGR54DRAFT_611156 [Hypoxylon sp. NC1633]